MAYYRCGPTAIGNRTSWGPVSSPGPIDPSFDRPLSGNFDRIFNAFERTTAFEYVKTCEEKEERHVGHQDVVVNRKMSSSFERADCALAAHAPCSDDEEFYREKILYSQARQLFPLQEDLADWINKTIGTTYLTGENFLDVLDNGAELCQLAAAIHDRAKEAFDLGLYPGPVPQLRGRCWQRAARRSFFSRDNTENFITFCRELGVHENLLFESDDLVLHNQPRQVILCLLELARLAARCGLEPPGLVQLEREIALEERDSGLDSAMSGAAWQFRGDTPTADKTSIVPAVEHDTESVGDKLEAASTKSEGSSDSDVPLKPTNELDKRVQLVTRLMERGCSCAAPRCAKLLKVKKVGEGRYNIAGRNVFIRLLKGRHMMVRVGGGWDTLEHFLSRHDPCQVRLVTPGNRTRTLPTPTTPPDSPTGTISPVSKASSGKASPVDKRSSPSSRGSTPRVPRTSLSLPLNETQTPRRKQSAPPSFSTPSTPTTRQVRTPEYKKSLTTSTLNAPKKSRSMSLAKDDKSCGTDRLNASVKKNGTAPADVGRKTRSQSLATTPVNEVRKPFGKKTRSMSLATSVEPSKPMAKSVSVNSALTQAAIEASIRLSLEQSLHEHSDKKPFLHIKAKYRSPPPREVPPR